MVSDCRFGLSPVNYPDPDPVRRSSSPLYMTLQLDWTYGNKLMQSCWIPGRLLIKFPTSALQSSSITMASETKTYPGSKAFSRIENSKWSLMRRCHLVLLSHPEFHKAQCLDLSCSWYTSMTYPQFADDCLLYRVIRDQQDAASLQTDLNHLQEWEREWQMVFSPDKCEHIRITHKRKVIQTSYNIHAQTF